MIAVIVAGGTGDRLKPITYEIPKPLVLVQGRPVIQYLTDRFFLGRFEKVYIIIRQEHRKAFVNWAFELRQTHIELVSRENPLGTFGSLNYIKDELKKHKNFFLTNADELKDINIFKMLKMHQTAKGLGTLAVKEYDDISDYGNVVLNNNKIVKFEEKKKEKRAGNISLGFYCLSSKVLDYLEPDKFQMVETDLFPKLAEQGELYAYDHKGQFFPTDDLKKYEKAILEYRKSGVK